MPIVAGESSRMSCACVPLRRLCMEFCVSDAISSPHVALLHRTIVAHPTSRRRSLHRGPPFATDLVFFFSSYSPFNVI
ncbi:uncharacterized protein DS421_11g325920 [Arachis hypogaea]|nr:uncharacterized protein DS421_11g325920 [Arachis hypogaea]